MSFIVDGVAIIGGIGVVYYGWLILFGNAKYKRWEREGRRQR